MWPSKKHIMSRQKMIEDATPVDSSAQTQADEFLALTSIRDVYEKEPPPPETIPKAAAAIPAFVPSRKKSSAQDKAKGKGKGKGKSKSKSKSAKGDAKK